MSNSNPGSEEMLRKELLALGAREFEVIALTMEPERGLAALNYATSKGADYPISYAIKIFDNEDWSPSGEVRRKATNVSVERACNACGGHRFVPVTDDWTQLYGETWAPCAQCNPGCNTTFWAANGERRVSVAR